MPDYRRQFINGEFIGGKPYYKQADLWWAKPEYMTSVGDIPEGTSFTKPNKPEDVIKYSKLLKDIETDKKFLDDTDKNFIELQAYKAGLRKYLTEEKASELERIEEARDQKASLIHENKLKLEALKKSIIEKYGEGALLHI